MKREGDCQLPFPVEATRLLSAQPVSIEFPSW